jgi:hypothetical protein
MQRLLLGLAGLAAAISTPAYARDRTLVGNGRPDAVQFGGGPVVDGRFCREFRHDRDRESDRRRFDRCGGGVAMDWYGGEWALYNNRSFAPDSYNDWWHDRPDRAYPAWMRHNRDCQRQWFSGDVLRC